MEINASEILYPLVAVKKDGNIIDRFAGCSFPIDDKGAFATCSHIIENLGADEFLAAKNIGQPGFSKINIVKCHKKYDFAVYKISTSNSKVHPQFQGKLNAGTNIAVIGLTQYKKTGAHIDTNLRCFKGNIVCRVDHEHPDDPRSASVFETSFPSLEGFSGGPVFTENFDYLVGMMFGNRENRIQAHLIDEVDDSGERYVESTNRIIELGLLHSIDDINRYIAEMENTT